MFKKLIFLSTLFVTIAGSVGAQVLTNSQIDIIAGSGVYNTNAVIYTPANYSPTTQYPLVIFTHGMGEAGSNINVLYNTGLPAVLKSGYRPSFDFIMVAPQRQSYSVDPAWLPAILEESKKRWNIDESRVYLTGLSAGGWGCYGSQLNIDTFLAKKIAAIEVNSAATQDANKTHFDWFKISKTPVWAVVGDADISYREQNIYMVNEINKRIPGLASITIRPGVGHGGWNDVYSGLVKNGTRTMWDWLYQFKKGSTPTPAPAPAPVPAPVPAPGAGQLINDKIDVIEGSGIYNVNAVIYLPSNYSSTKSYPLVIYGHGVAEAGTDINRLYNAGLPKVLKNGYVPPIEFIMVAPQHSSYAVDPKWLTGVIEDSKRRWNIDSSRIYLTGYGAAGFTTYGAELNVTSVLAKKFAAIVINSGATQDVNKTHFDWFKTSNTHLWAVVGDLDVTFRDQNKLLVDEINKQVAGLANITIRSGIGHSGWDDVYNGTVKNGTKNMWEWMYQFKK